MHRPAPASSGRRRPRAVPAAIALAAMLLVPTVATGHGTAGHGSEAEVRRQETRTLGARHAAEHASERRALRQWNALPAAERRQAARDARQAAARSAANAAPADQVGRWSAVAVDLPTWAINAVVLPTGKVAFWGRDPLGTDGRRSNVAPFYLWDPATGDAVRRDPPQVALDLDGDGLEDDIGAAPIFCSGQSLLPSGELFVAGGNRFYPDYGPGHDDFGGWSGTYSFDPWTERWTVQPEMQHGRWYPTQVELPDGRIAIVAGYDESGNGYASRNNTLELFTPPSRRGDVGLLQTLPAGHRDTTGYYPNMQVVPGGKVMLAGPGQGDTALLDPTKLGSATEGAAWTQTGETNWTYRAGGSASLLPGGIGGSSRMMLLGGYNGEDVDGDGLQEATSTVETTDLSRPFPQWTTGGPGDVPDLNRRRSNGNLVLLPDGGFAYVGGAAGFRSGHGPSGNNTTEGDQALKAVELWRPGQSAWTLGPASRKWRSYHSTAVLLPDGRILSAGDDYWGFDDTPHQGRETPQDRGELYEPAYLFDGDQRAPRPRITSGPAAVRWGATFGVGISEVGGRPITRATLVAPSAVTHAVDMNRGFAELEVVDRVAGKGVDLRAPAGPDLAPPGWYMLFAFDAAGTPAVARWVQITADAPDAPLIAPPGGGGTTTTTPPTTEPPVSPPTDGPTVGPPTAPPPTPAPPSSRPAADRRAPKIGLVVRRPSRGSHVLRLRIGGDEPARIRLRTRVDGERSTTRTVTLTRSRLGTTVGVRLSRRARRLLSAGRSIRLRIDSDARDAVGNRQRRTLRLVLRAGRAPRRG